MTGTRKGSDSSTGMLPMCAIRYTSLVRESCLRVDRREQPQAKAREADHHDQHPVLGAYGLLGGAVHRDRAVVREREAAHVTDHEREHLDVPDASGVDHVVVDVPVGGAEEVRAIA